MIRFSSVSYCYPHVAEPALKNIDLHVRAGELVLCTGPSGCGKSTLIRIANGLIPHILHGRLKGQVMVGGQDTIQLRPAKVAEEVGTLFQDPEQQFFALTVEDEMAVSLQWRGWQPRDVQRAIGSAAESLGISGLLTQTIFSLSEGQKQKVALASLLASRPKALVLDEPSANLDPESANEFACILAELKKDGMAILVVDHRLAWLQETADHLVVLDEGRISAEGSFDMLKRPGFCVERGLRAPFVNDCRVSLMDLASADIHTSAFACEGVHFGHQKEKPLFKDFSFGFRPGEVTALVGPNGVGKTTLARLCTGLEKSAQGRFFVRGEDTSRRKLSRHAQVVLQNAGHQLRMRTVEAELVDAVRSLGGSPEEGRKAVEEFLVRFGLDHMRERHPQSLSGGEKQRLALAATAIRMPSMLILDEPTSGLDGRNMLRVAACVQEAADKGASVLVITHDLELMHEVCGAKLVLSGACA